MHLPISYWQLTPIGTVKLIPSRQYPIKEHGDRANSQQLIRTYTFPQIIASKVSIEVSLVRLPSLYMC